MNGGFPKEWRDCDISPLPKVVGPLIADDKQPRFWWCEEMISDRPKQVEFFLDATLRRMHADDMSPNEAILWLKEGQEETEKKMGPLGDFVE
ncbi:hypothetical protein SUGI_1159890 [Cryptomeria japonica]|nr:hypothetical protein SUGI_1159890 [Cryptomeria japonica]